MQWFFVVVVLSGSKSWFCSITIQNLPSHRFCSSSSVCRWWAISWWMMGQSSATSNMEISSRTVSSLVSEAKTCSAKALILSSVSVMRTESLSNRNAFRSYNTMQHRTKLGGPHSGLPAMIYITKWKNFKEENLGHDVLHCIAFTAYSSMMCTGSSTSIHGNRLTQSLQLGNSDLQYSLQKSCILRDYTDEALHFSL